MHELDPWPTVRRVDVAPLPDNLAVAPESGFGALVAFCSWPNVYILEAPPATTAIVDAMTGQRRSRRRTHQEQLDVSADITSFLADAGVGPPPDGYEFLIKLPNAMSEDKFWAIINDTLANAPDFAVSPTAQRVVITQVLEHLYGTGPSRPVDGL